MKLEFEEWGIGSPSEQLLREAERVMDLMELARENGSSRIYKHLAEQVEYFNDGELR